MLVKVLWGKELKFECQNNPEWHPRNEMLYFYGDKSLLCSRITINPTDDCGHSVGGSFVSFVVVLEHNEREWP